MTETQNSHSDATAVHSPHRIGVILVGGGSGERLGAGKPKAFVELGGKTLLEHSVETVLSLEGPGHLVVVAPDSHAVEALAVLETLTERTGAKWSTNVARGGAERQFSVLNGLEQMPDWVEIVLVHDVARPLTPASLFVDIIHAVRTKQVGVIPVLPVVDTVKRVDGAGAVLETVDRSALVHAQTPQGFLKEELSSAYERARGALTDDASVVQSVGGEVTTIPGSVLAHKLTTQSDAELLQCMLDTERKRSDS